ncbi:hypothetical protein H6F38_23245 [Paenibacillus sp. EKM208P]|nr:hypothetical protein H6F38_23245 [Paenibacillus sp. EKM208P]
MKQPVVTNCTVTSEFANGFDVDFNLEGESKTFSGRIYIYNERNHKYEMAVYMYKEMTKYTKEPHSEETRLIAEQIVTMLNYNK